MFVGIGITILLISFLLVIFIRTILFKPKELVERKQPDFEINEEKIINDMVLMIQKKTISYRDESLIEWNEFQGFYELLERKFPNVHKCCEVIKISNTGLIYHLQGKSNQKPSVCMAHYDVVPVEEEQWSVEPFLGIVKDGKIWGRGTLDTKGTVCGIFEATEQLLEGDFIPNNDLYLCFSGEEEIDGSTCPEMVSYFEKQGITPEFVLDEGGAIVEGAFPGVNKACAVIGTGEKGSVNIDLTLKSNGGHASAPPIRSIIGKLGEAVIKIEKKPFKRQLTKPVQELFDTMGRHSTFLYRMIFANLWCFEGVLDRVCKSSGGELNALMRTTTAVTKAEASKAYNVMPPKATIGMNLRLLGNDTVESVVSYLKKVVNDEAIDLEVVNGMNPSIYSDTSSLGYGILRETIEEVWPDTVVTPYLMMACSDARHYCRITDKVYRFSAMKLSKEERAMIHGNDECIPIETLLSTVRFYVQLISKL